MLDHDKITIHDIAEVANVSISTVSRVLRGSAPVSSDKREAVMQAIEQLNYRPNIFAQSLASGESHAVGVLTQNISSPFYDAILRGVLLGLSESVYSPIFADGYWDPQREKAALHTLMGRKVDGLIVLGGATPDAALQAIAASVPMVVVGRAVPGILSLTLDDFRGAYLATQHLTMMGHRRIAHITGVLSHDDAVVRRRGYEQALRDGGLAVDPTLVVEGDYTEQSGVVAVEMLLAQGRTFSAIFCANDQTAIGARLALFRHGLRVPDDVSLVGFDDQPMAAFMTPPLTTVRQPPFDIGMAAAEALLHVMTGQRAPVEKPVFPASLVVRDSVRRVR